MSDTTIQSMLDTKQLEFLQMSIPVAKAIGRDKVLETLDRIAKQQDRNETLKEIMEEYGFIDQATQNFTEVGRMFHRLSIIDNQMRQIKILGTKQALERQQLELSLKD